MDKSRFSLNEAGTLFIVLAIAFLTLSAMAHSFGFVAGILITEYVILLLPIITFALIKKKNLTKVFKLKKISKVVALKTILLAVMLVPLVAFANLIALFVINVFAEPIEMQIPVATQFSDFIVLFFVIAITAGVCEEFFFRGMILDAFENETNLKTAAIFSALLFAIFHFNPQNFFGPFVLGFVFSYLTQLTGSIWTAVIAHTANNGIAVTMGYVLNFTTQTESQINQIEMLKNPEIIIGVMLFYGVLSIGAFFLAKSMIHSIKQHFPRLEVGDSFAVHGKHYTIIESNDEELVFVDTKNTSTPLMSKIEMLKTQPFKSYYSLWNKEKFHRVPMAMLMTGAGVVLYSVVLYYAYFKGM